MKTHVLTCLKHIKTFLFWLLVAALTGAVCGVVGALFHLAVDWATEIRTEHGWLLYLLPAAGLLIAALYRITRTEGVGTNNIIHSIHTADHIPTVLVPVIFCSHDPHPSLWRFRRS